MRTIWIVFGSIAAIVFLIVYAPFRPWISAEYGPDDRDDPGEDVGLWS